ncbi:MAG: hypothetical protein LQ347_005224, partial [Umbilicaria vellea]
MAVFSKIAPQVTETLLTCPKVSVSSRRRAAAATSARSDKILVAIILAAIVRQIEQNQAAIITCKDMVRIFKGLVPWPSASKQIAMVQEVIHLSTTSSEAREDLSNTKEDEKKKCKESEKGEKSEKSKKAKAKAKAKKSRQRANQAARADGKGNGKGKAIQKEPDWKSKSQIFTDKLFGAKNDKGDGDDPNAPTQYTISKLLNTISKRRIALPEEAQPNKPSSSETPFPYPNNFINDFVLAFERSQPGGTKDIRDLQSHLWHHEGELGRVLDLFDLDTSHRQTQKFTPFTQDGVIKRKLFRMTDLPPNVLRRIFKHILVPAEMVIPYRYQSDSSLDSVLHTSNAVAKPDTNVLVAFCSRNRATAAVCDEARNVLYNDNTFLFHDPRDFIHFVSTVGWENIIRLNFKRNIRFRHDFFERATDAERHWISTTGVKVASDMLGLRSWSAGWEEVESATPPPGERAAAPVWAGAETFEPVRHASHPVTSDGPAADAIGLAVTTSYTRPYTDITEGAHFFDGDLVHVDRVDRHRALGRYNDGDGMGWYHVGYWREKRCFYRWYEAEMGGKREEE